MSQISAQSLLESASRCRHSGAAPDAIAFYRQAASLLKEDGDVAAAAAALSAAASLLGDLRRTDEARACLAEASTMLCDSGDDRELAQLLLQDAELAGLDEARPLFEDAITRLVWCGDLLAAAHALKRLGHFDCTAGRQDLAVDHYRRALHLCRKAGDSLEEASVLLALGEVQRQLGHPDLAHADFEAAIALFLENGDRLGQIRATADLGRLLQELHQPREARKYLESAATLAAQAGALREEADLLLSLAQLEGDIAGEERRAQRHLDHAASLYQQCRQTGLGEVARAMRLELAEP